MKWFKLVARKTNGIEKLVLKEQKSLNDLEEWKPVLPSIVQVYQAKASGGG